MLPYNYAKTMPKLVIVESPAKANTISRFLGAEYEVLASFGHVRDLPEKADDIPAEMKKEKWAKLGVNVDGNFEPLYVVSPDKKKHVSNLKAAAKGATAILLATDEDREGESISWHILQLLKPSKSTPVSRIVFHEITPEAIDAALKSPRALDENLVRAQEARRILDRLYGYTLSPLLWKKVAPKLSAGRVQSVATRLIVMRERERAAFISATYWDLLAKFSVERIAMDMRLTHIADRRISTGKSFEDTTGKVIDGSLLVDETRAKELAKDTFAARPWTVSKVEKTPGQEKPPVPFMTSTLQQEANRKLNFASQRTMKIAQGLYEGVDLGGERVGLITYMRTDSLHLAERAVEQCREVIQSLYGAEYLPAKPVRFKTKAKGAQEAHEAIRPTDLSRRPQDVKRFLDKDQFALYELIWKRTIACQMVPAQVDRTSVDVEISAKGEQFNFHASGKQIKFPGFLRAYVEGSDDPEAEIANRETALPDLKVGKTLEPQSVDAESHTTKPPARYTEASLVKKLEEAGVGRPSTYASIIGTIQDRGYVRKKVNELIPTFTAFAVTELLESNFEELVDTDFTAKLETELDEIADGQLDYVEHLREFFHGTPEHPGLNVQVEKKGQDIPFPVINLGETEDGQPVVVRVGRFGVFAQRGEGGPLNSANIPDDIAPAELGLEEAISLINERAQGPAAVAHDPDTGKAVIHRKGRFGDYLELEQSEEERARGDKPKRITLPKGVNPSSLDEADLTKLLRFPLNLGVFDQTKEPIVVTIGQYGPYVKSGTETRNIADWREAAELTHDAAVALLKAPKPVRGRGAAGATPRAAIKEFGGMKVLDGRYGPYVTDGKTNATIPKSISPENITEDEARELIAARAAAGPSKKRGSAARKGTRRKSKA